ncbi:Movement protein p22 [Bienertia sinuspersici]
MRPQRIPECSTFFHGVSDCRFPDITLNDFLIAVEHTVVIDKSFAESRSLGCKSNLVLGAACKMVAKLLDSYSSGSDCWLVLGFVPLKSPFRLSFGLYDEEGAEGLSFLFSDLCCDQISVSIGFAEAAAYGDGENESIDAKARRRWNAHV